MHNLFFQQDGLIAGLSLQANIVTLHLDLCVQNMLMGLHYFSLEQDVLEAVVLQPAGKA